MQIKSRFYILFLIIILNYPFIKVYQTFVLHKERYAQDSMYLYACFYLYLSYGIIGFKDNKGCFIP